MFQHFYNKYLLYIIRICIICVICIVFFIMKKLKKKKRKHIRNSKRHKRKNDNNKETNICMVSHGGRIKCLLKKLNISVDDGNGKSIKFKNCATVLLKISKKQIDVSLFHDGELEHVKPNCKYFVKKNIKKTYDTLFDGKTYNSNDIMYDDILDNLNLKRSDITSNFNIYIIRHSEGHHNTLSLYEKIIYFNDLKDPTITKIGKKQSKHVGNALKNIRFDYYFVSDLKRTKQTLNNMFKNINDDVYVLPCSHELQYVNNGNSDGHQYFASLTKENQTGHDYDDDDSLVWDYYHEFYDGVRGDDVLIKNCRCRDTNMISMCLFIIKSINCGDNIDISEWINNRVN